MHLDMKIKPMNKGIFFQVIFIRKSESKIELNFNT
jgi:hypothetical protein